MLEPAVVLISSNSEWRAVKAFYSPRAISNTPYGEAFELNLNRQMLFFTQGGVGKVSAAASTEYAIQHWRPQVLVNLGTCGGIAGAVEIGDILLAEKTVIYDIYEQMGDAAAALARYTTQLDLAWLPSPFPLSVRRATLLSADRDLHAEDIPMLRSQFNANAVDWESGSIAWVAARHSLPCLILRGVTDLVSVTGGEAYGNIHHYHQHTAQIMPRLLASLSGWLNP